MKYNTTYRRGSTGVVKRRRERWEGEVKWREVYRRARRLEGKELEFSVIWKEGKETHAIAPSRGDNENTMLAGFECGNDRCHVHKCTNDRVLPCLDLRNSSKSSLCFYGHSAGSLT